MVVDDPWTYGGVPSISIPKGPYATALVSLHDYIENGTVVKLSSTKPLIGALPNAAGMIGENASLNQTLLSNTNPVQIPVSVVTEAGTVKDAKINIAQFISMLGAGIADSYADGGYETFRRTEEPLGLLLAEAT